MMNVSVSALSLLIRRFPFEAGRWRLIPYAIKQCQRRCTTPTIRTVRTRHGFRMRLDVSEWLGRHIFVTGEYEPSTTALVKACLQRNGSFVDVGANAGYFSLLAATCVGPEGRIFSFEPLPEVRRSLVSNLDLNGLLNCDVSGVALSNQEGESEFFAGPVSHYGVSSLRRIDDSSGSIRVRTAEMDDVLSDIEAVDLVKIDVEGAECHVLEGMTQTLQRFSPDIVIEISPKYLRDMGKSTSDLDELLTTIGYRLYAIEYNGLRPLRDLASYPSDQFNAFVTIRDIMPQGIEVLPEERV